jgi:hypothetical protein
MALTYGELASITEKKFIPVAVDQIFTSNVLFQRMRKGKMYETYDGGLKIVQPLIYALTTASGSYSGSETLDTSANDQITAAEFDMKTYFANITITRTDELKNSGDAQKVNLVKAKVMIAEKTLSDNLGTGVFNAGTVAKDLLGLRLAYAITGTYGGIAKATYSWWQGQVDSTTTTLTIPALETLVGQCTIGNDKPSLIITTQAQFDAYHGLLQPQERYTDEDTASGGFKNLLFRGIPIVVDNHCPSGYMFLINENYLKLYVHKDENFRFEPFQKPTDKNMACAKIYWAGELVCSNCRMNGMFSALT